MVDDFLDIIIFLFETGTVETVHFLKFMLKGYLDNAQFFTTVKGQSTVTLKLRHLILKIVVNLEDFFFIQRLILEGRCDVTVFPDFIVGPRTKTIVLRKGLN